MRPQYNLQTVILCMHQIMMATYQGGEGLHSQAGAHHNQQVSLGEVCGHVLEEASW